MGSTTQQQEQVYRPEQAQRLLESQKWSAALAECDGLLNSGNWEFFNRTDIWTMRAIAQLRLGQLKNANHSLIQAQRLDRSGDNAMLVWFLRHKLIYHGERGEIGQADQALANMVEWGPVGFGWAAMRSGRVRYTAANRITRTRGRRDELLYEAAGFFADAEKIWSTTDEEVAGATRVENLKLWFLSLANQSHPAWNDELPRVLERIEPFDHELASRLRKKLRHRKLLGFHLHA